MQGRENEVTGERSLDGDFSRFKVANLTDKNDVGILAKERPEGRGEVQTDLLLHLHLVDAGKVELNRIFGGHDVCLDRVERLERGVKRVCFTASSWTSDEHHSIRLGNVSLELGQRLRFKTEFGHVEHEVL